MAQTQTFNCNAFSVKAIKINPDTKKMDVTIFFATKSKIFSKAFINYPYVSLIKDANGDTLGTGGMSLYGHFGNQSRIYEVTTDLDALPARFNWTVHFNYNNAICELAYSRPAKKIRKPSAK